MAHFQNLQLGTLLQMLRLVDAIGYDDFVQSAGVDALNSIAAQDPVRY
jgi:hypothetical protein